MSGAADSAAPSRLQSPRYCPSLDGQRAIAVLLVMLFHYQVPGFSRGYLGVDVFFVLSGFLITSLLIAEQRRKGQISLPGFWQRRIRRLTPLYLGYVSLITVIWFTGVLRWVTFGPDPWPVGRHFASIWLYFSNFRVEGGYLQLGDAPLTTHLWSLAVEEQFYLIWPFVLIGILTRRAWWLLWAIGGLQLLVLTTADDWDDVAFLLHGRGYSMWTGCAAALLLVWSPGFRRLVERRWLPWVALVLAVVIYEGTNHLEIDHTLVYNVSLPLFGPPLALLCASLWLRDTGPIARVLSLRPLVYVGKISYGVYMWHMLCHALILQVRGGLGPLPVAVLSTGVTLVVAAASFRFYESRFLRHTFAHRAAHRAARHAGAPP